MKSPRGYGKLNFFVGRKRIKSQLIFKPSDDNCEAK